MPPQAWLGLCNQPQIWSVALSKLSHRNFQSSSILQVYNSSSSSSNASIRKSLNLTIQRILKLLGPSFQIGLLHEIFHASNYWLIYAEEWIRHQWKSLLSMSSQESCFPEREHMVNLAGMVNRWLAGFLKLEIYNLQNLNFTKMAGSSWALCITTRPSIIVWRAR